jgi:hypothetical protein
VQPVAIRRRRELIEQLTLTRDQTDIKAPATQIKTHMQHEHLLLAQRQAGSDQRTAYRNDRSVLLFRTAGRAGATARLTYAVRD